MLEWAYFLKLNIFFYFRGKFLPCSTFITGFQSGRGICYNFRKKIIKVELRTLVCNACSRFSLHFRTTFPFLPFSLWKGHVFKLIEKENWAEMVSVHCGPSIVHALRSSLGRFLLKCTPVSSAKNLLPPLQHFFYTYLGYELVPATHLLKILRIQQFIWTLGPRLFVSVCISQTVTSLIPKSTVIIKIKSKSTFKATRCNHFVKLGYETII